MVRFGPHFCYDILTNSTFRGFTRFEDQPLKTIERRKNSKKKCPPNIRKKHVPEKYFIDEMNRIDKLVEREAYGVSKYRVIHQKISRLSHLIDDLTIP